MSPGSNPTSSGGPRLTRTIVLRRQREFDTSEYAVAEHALRSQRLHEASSLYHQSQLQKMDTAKARTWHLRIGIFRLEAELEALRKLGPARLVGHLRGCAGDDRLGYATRMEGYACQCTGDRDERDHIRQAG